MLKPKKIWRKIFPEKKITYQDKIFKHRLKLFYRVGLVTAILIAVAVLIKVYIDNKVYIEYEVLATGEKIGTAESIYAEYAGNLLIHSKDGIAAYDADGKQIWNQTYEMQSPIVKTNGTYVAAGDYKGSIIYVMDVSGVQGQINTNLPIQDLYISNKGVVAAVVEDGAITWIKLYSATGETIVDVKTRMENTGYPIALSMSPDNIKLAVSYLLVQSGEVSTNIAFYNFGDVGQNQTENLVSAYPFAEQIVPFIEFADNNNSVAVGDRKLFVFKGRQVPVKEIELDIEEDVQSVFYSESLLCLVYHNTESAEKYKINVYDLNGKLLVTKPFDLEYRNITFCKDQIIIYNDVEVLIFNTKGLEKYKDNMGGDIRTLIPTDSKTKYVVVRSDRVETIRLR